MIHSVITRSGEKFVLGRCGTVRFFRVATGFDLASDDIGASDQGGGTRGARPRASRQHPRAAAQRPAGECWGTAGTSRMAASPTAHG